MFWLVTQHGDAAVSEAAGHAAEVASHAGAAHAEPPLIQLVNHYLGDPVYRFEINYTQPLWDRFLGYFGTNAEAVFGPYTPETAIPWYTTMFVVACLISLFLIWVMKGRLSTDEPGGGQQALEVGVLALRGMIEDIIGPHGLKYFPVVATFSTLILVSNLMGLLPGLMSPSTSTSVTFALGISSFLYYNYIGIRENGLGGHLGHLAGVNYFSGAMLVMFGPVMFCIELISNLVRPVSLGMRLFGNIFGDHKVVEAISSLYPPWTEWVLPAGLMFLGVFASVMQTFIFTLLSMIYIGEVSHAPHHHEDDNDEYDGDEIVAPVLT